MMSEEALKEEENLEPELIEESEPTPQESQALDRGWKPKDDWEGEEDGWVSAAEFNRRGELMGKIAAQNRKINELENNYVAISDHYKKVQDTEYQRALVDLKARKKEALDNDDTETIVEVDDAIQDLKQDFNSNESAQAESNGTVPSSQYNSWQEVNSWYNTDLELTPIADGLAKAFIQSRGNNVSEVDVLNHVSKEIKSIYPEKFGGTKRAAQTVSSSNRTTRTKKSTKKVTRANLNDTQKSIMDGFVRSGVMTEEQYINDLVAIGDLS